MRNKTFVLRTAHGLEVKMEEYVVHFFVSIACSDYGYLLVFNGIPHKAGVRYSG